MLSFERGNFCRFKLVDVICPERRQVLNQITADMSVSGSIVFLSDQGRQADRFAIVEVEGILSPLIVPVEFLQPMGVEDKEHREETTSF